MPRVIRVGDKDNHSQHPVSAVDDEMQENDATMWLNEPGVGAIAAAISLGLPSTEGISEEAAADALSGIADESAAGGDPTRTEPLENDAPGASFPPPEVGEPAIPPEGTNGATGLWNNYAPVPNDEFLKFRGRSMLPGAENESQVDPAIADIARQIAQRLGIQLSINSAYRDRTHNNRVGGASNSLHMRGYALDLSWPSSNITDKQNFIKYAIESGAQGIGVYNSFIHIDIGGKRAWGPNGSRTSLPRLPWAQSVLSQAGYATS